MTRSRRRIPGPLVRWFALGAALVLAVVVIVLVGRGGRSEEAAGLHPSEHLALTQGWARATTDSPQPTISAVYGVLTNTGSADRVLVSATTSAAVSTGLLRYTGTTGTPQFEAAEAVRVPAGGTATLEPEGVRLLLSGASAIEPDSTVYVQLVFDDGSTVDAAVTARVFEEVDLEGGWWHGDHFHPAGDDSHGPPPTT